MTTERLYLFFNSLDPYLTTFQTNSEDNDRGSNVSPHSNNAYKHAAPPGTIKVSIKGGAFPMPQQKLTIVPVTLH